MKGIFNETKHYHDGKWLLIRIQDDKYINELIEMIKIKKNQRKTYCISKSMLLEIEL
ncbi:DUF3788 domain-containing protein [Clostridium botulinum]|nr:DUF3788 domain-containing protein [Clostridium botulinum]